MNDTHRPYQRCTNCVMDTSDSAITFDEHGVCDFCNDFYQNIQPSWQDKLKDPDLLRRTAEQIKALAPDGIMLSNGPGDPAEPVEVIENLKHIFELNIPTFGICLGHQLSALAAGAKTMKLKYGHRGANQPVTDFESGRTFITSQNHGYAVVGDELPAEMGEVAQVNANDGTCEGIKYKKWNCFTVQFHPEANGGPKDTEFLFDRFLNNVKAAKEAR